MFEDLDDLDLNLLIRALNTERNTIEKAWATHPIMRVGPNGFDEQKVSISKLYDLAVEESSRRFADRLLNDQMDLLVANEIAMNFGEI